MVRFNYQAIAQCAMFLELLKTARETRNTITCHRFVTALRNSRKRSKKNAHMETHRAGQSSRPAKNRVLGNVDLHSGQSHSYIKRLVVAYVKRSALTEDAPIDSARGGSVTFRIMACMLEHYKNGHWNTLNMTSDVSSNIKLSRKYLTLYPLATLMVVCIDGNLVLGYNTILFRLIPRYIYSAGPHRHFCTILGLLHNQLHCSPNAQRTTA